MTLDAQQRVISQLYCAGESGETNLVVLHDAAAGRWLRFRRPLEIVTAADLGEVENCLRHVETLVERAGLHAAGLVSYEAAPAFDSALAVRPDAGFPLVWFGLYSAPEPIDLPRPPHSAPPVAWQPTVTEEEYARAIVALKESIAAGETYQVNYSFRLRQAFGGDPWRLFLDLAAAQPAQYAAYIDTPHWAICSASPELFFRLDGQRIVCRPMKGTAPRGRWPAEDAARAAELAASEKNRAENAMIVDMMRNDVGRIARPGSIVVGDVFRVERYPTLWQMTSRVEGRTDASLGRILAALFPCASVTGAPKPYTMRIISRLETTPRRMYTGTIGWMAPGRTAQFNVAIRTVLIEKAAGRAEYGVGGGVVWDSTSAGEFAECLLKARILTARREEFSLLETLLWTPEEGYFLQDEHLRRLEESAGYFGFPPVRAAVWRQLHERAAGLPPQPHRVRMTVSRTLDVTWEAAPLEPPPNDQPVRLELASGPVDAADPMLYHKTTLRTRYETARAECTVGDDVLLYNQRGEITETSIANVVVRVDGQLCTPPIESGLLPGVFRARLLAAGTIRERPIDLETLDRSAEIFVINSVRRWRPAVLVEAGGGRAVCAALRAKCISVSANRSTGRVF